MLKEMKLEFDKSNMHLESLFFIGLFVFTEIMHNLSDRFLNIINSIACIKKQLPISSTLPIIFLDI